MNDDRLADLRNPPGKEGEEHERLQTSLRQTTQLLKLIVDSANVGVVAYDKSFRCTLWNLFMEELTGISQQDALGKTPRDLLPFLVEQGIYELTEKALGGQSVQSPDFRYSLPSTGKSGWLSATFAPRAEADGDIIGVISTIRDITEKKEVEELRKAYNDLRRRVVKRAHDLLDTNEQLQQEVLERRKAEEESQKLQQQLFQAQKLESIGTLAGGIAHDFNNILGIIQGYVSVLRDPTALPEREAHAFDAITDAVKRGADLVRQVLTFAKKSEIKDELVDVNSSVREMEEIVNETFPKTIDVRLELDTSDPLILMGGTQLHQCLLNLCVNARDAMPHGGTLTLETKVVSSSNLKTKFPFVHHERYVCLQVSDTGVGMDPETQNRLFEPFFTTKGMGEGTGLGLAVVYGIVKSHGGMVDVQSRLGHGSTLSLFFPIASKERSSASRDSTEPNIDVRGHETVLLVEDEETLLELLENVFRAQGYEVLSARDGYEAYEVYRNNAEKIGVVVSDIGLPKLAGTDAFLKMRESNPKVKVIFVTGYLDDKRRQEVLRMGVDRILGKPCPPKELLKAVRESLDAKKIEPPYGS